MRPQHRRDLAVGALVGRSSFPSPASQDLPVGKKSGGAVPSNAAPRQERPVRHAASREEKALLPDFLGDLDDQSQLGDLFVPKGKKVVLGLITSKRPDMESKDLIRRRLEEASKFVPLDQICLSPQCGFSSTVDGNSLTWDEQVAKLRLVVEVAQEVWK